MEVFLNRNFTNHSVAVEIMAPIIHGLLIIPYGEALIGSIDLIVLAWAEGGIPRTEPSADRHRFCEAAYQGD